MTRKQAKIFARIHSSITLSYIDGFAFMPHMNSSETIISEKDQEKMIDEVKKIGLEILGSLPEFGDSIEIYNYVIGNY